MMRARVRKVIASPICSGVTLKRESMPAGTITGVPPTSVTISG